MLCTLSVWSIRGKICQILIKHYPIVILCSEKPARIYVHRDSGTSYFQLPITDPLWENKFVEFSQINYIVQDTAICRKPEDGDFRGA